jgi:hypothetical protein
MLSAGIRSELLQALFELPLVPLGKPLPAFTAPHLALQGYMDTRLIRKISQKYIVTIATYREIETEPFSQNVAELGGSIPDAWIFDPEQDYCFLFEAKVGSNPLDASQVISHARDWLHIPPAKLPQHLISLTWYDVLTSIQQTDLIVIKQQERLLLQEFTQFLGFFGYRVFKGFEFNQLLSAPRFSLPRNTLSGADIFDFEKLKEAPAFRLGMTLT